MGKTLFDIVSDRTRCLIFCSHLKHATQAYAEHEMDFKVLPREIPNAKTARQLKRQHADVLAGRNLSPFFHDSESAIAYLKAEVKKYRKPLLENHSLHGEYAGFHSINVTGDYRAIFEELGDRVVFHEIGTHHELFGS